MTEGTDGTEPTVTLAVAVKTVSFRSNTYGDLYEALMSAVPFEIPLIRTFVGTGHPMAAQLPIISIDATPGLLEVHSATTGIGAGIT